MIIKPRDRVLDRRIPKSFEHVTKYPGRALRMISQVPAIVEVNLKTPNQKKYQGFSDQLNEGACVGFGESIAMSILNRRLYDPWWLYREAQIIDPWPETPPEAGTDLASGFDVLRTRGHRRIYAGESKPPKIDEGIVAVNRWITSVDEGRAALANKIPAVDGIAWFDAFYEPIQRRVKVNGRYRTEYWLPEPDKWGHLAGYHCICRTAASDDRQAFGYTNSWGTSYPWPVYISYEGHNKLMQIQGESAVVTDR